MLLCLFAVSKSLLSLSLGSAPSQNAGSSGCQSNQPGTFKLILASLNFNI